MSYSATVYKIFIASPSDVEGERKIAVDVIHKWNNSNSERRGIVLMPILWEHNSAPEMGRSGQAIINEQLLDNADVLVGIFWAKIGTATSKAKSGTIEEITRHMDKKKLTMLYFSDESIPQNHNKRQFTEVQKLRRKYKSDGLLTYYNSGNDFESKFRHHLERHVNNHSAFGNNDEKVEEIDYVNIYTSAKLMDTARVLLVEAYEDPKHQIIFTYNKDGKNIQTNGHTVSEPTDTAEDVAEWIAGLDELDKNNLVRKVSNSIFELTFDGLKLAPHIRDEIDKLPPK